MTTPIENLDSITIGNMLDNIFTATTVKKKRKEIVDFYRQHLVTDLFSTSADSVTEEQVAKRVDEVLKADSKSAAPYLTKGKDGKYHKSRNKGNNIGVPQQDIEITTNYVGKAGECAVMSELLFYGYNVNNMMVDEGIDLIASKNNMFYYIQVKTRYADATNKFHFPIKKRSFDRYIEAQMRYILVGRGKIGNNLRNIYFVFNNTDIDRLRHNGIIGTSDAGNININIDYDAHDGKAYAYNGKNREDVSYYMEKITSGQI